MPSCESGGVRTRLLAATLALVALMPVGALSAPQACVPTPRPGYGNAALAAQRATFGFHDEELVLCSDGGGASPIHIAARLWVPESCPGVGGCAGMVIAHGFGFNKEVTFSDMYQAVQRGMYVLSYDVRGQGASGGQGAFLAREDIADQAMVLRWWHENVRPTKTAFYGISQGGWLSWTAAVFNCGAGRAAAYDSAVSCDEGGRWIDAIAPVQSPTKYLDDGTCPIFMGEVLAYSRGNPVIASSLAPCITEGRPGEITGVILDVEGRLDRVDVPVYAVTSFYDRLVLPQLITTAYEHLHARSVDPDDGYYGKDVRLTISNDGHGAVGGNIAVINDVFGWIDHHINGGPPLREPKVAIAQEWADATFRLEHGWPIPETTTKGFFLSRTSGKGALAEAPGGDHPDELRNVPVVASPPEIPFANAAVGFDNTDELPAMRLVYMTPPSTETMEITGLPSARLWVSSANAASKGTGQLHVFLSEVAADGSVHTFSQTRIGLTDLGPTPVAITVPLTVSAHRVDAGNRLMMSITPSDVGVVIPARGTDPFYVHHSSAAPSSITVPLAPVDRTAPPGEPPSGAAYTDDPIGALCEAFDLPC
jgi:predicted acyl esterase